MTEKCIIALVIQRDGRERMVEIPMDQEAINHIALQAHMRGLTFAQALAKILQTAVDKKLT